MTFRFLIALCSLAAAGCAVQNTTLTERPTAPAAATPEPAPAPASSPLPPVAATAETAATPPSDRAGATTNPATPAPQPAPAPKAVATAAPNPADKPGVATAPDEHQAPAAAGPATDTLDFASLGARLRSTKAIGVLTKLSVKNQADDLLEQFRDYYKRRSTATLPDLQHSYDMLVLKLLALLQDGDPPLATDINRSRAAIWDILSDQRKFTDSNLMAGASL